jgi:hypothetical protein
MNKGFNTYYKQGMKDTKMLLKKKSNFFKFFVYAIMSLFGMCIIPNITQISFIKVSKKVHEDKDISLIDAFSFGDKPLNIYNIIVVGLLKVLLLVTGIVVASLIGGLFYLLGVALSMLFFDNMFTTITFVLSGIGTVALIIFMYFYIFYLSHCSYLVSETKNLTPTKVVSTSISLSKNGKLVLFLNFLMMIIIFLGYNMITFAYFFVVSHILPIYTTTYPYVISFLFFLGILIFSLILVFVLPYAILPSMISSYLLRKDLCLGDKQNNYAYTNVNVDTSKLNKKYINVKTAEENLNTLFDQDTSKNTPKENEVSSKEEIVEEIIDDNQSLDTPTSNVDSKEGENNDTF